MYSGTVGRPDWNMEYCAIRRSSVDEQFLRIHADLHSRFLHFAVRMFRARVRPSVRPRAHSRSSDNRPFAIRESFSEHSTPLEAAPGFGTLHTRAINDNFGPSAPCTLSHMSILDFENVSTPHLHLPTRDFLDADISQGDNALCQVPGGPEA